MNAPFIPQADRTSFLLVVEAHFEARPNERFTAATKLNSLRLDEFNNKLIEGTIFTEIEAIMHSQGMPSDGTFGSLKLLNQRDAHILGCSCNGAEVTGSELARRIRSLL